MSTASSLTLERQPFVAMSPFVAAPMERTDSHISRDIAPMGRGVEFGPLARLVDDPEVTDVFVNGPGPVWFDRGAGLVVEPGLSLGADELRELAVRLVGLGGRHIDEVSPCVDTRLPGGIRVHAVLPPLSPSGTLLSVRIPRRQPFTLDDLEAAGFFRRFSAQGVRRLVGDRVNVLVTGAGGSGKTTLLAAMISSAAATERIVCIEDVAELRLTHPHAVTLEARQPNLEGIGGITVARLLREALRMRPDRLVLGECRGAEVRELFGALNTGHDGGAGTLHANSLADVPARLEALGALAHLTPEATARQAVSAIGAVLHVERHGGARALAAVGTLVLDGSSRLAVGPPP